MIRSCSEAIYETIGSIMNQHGGKIAISNLSISTLKCFWVNLGPIHHLKDFVNDVFVSDLKNCVRKENSISNITSQDINKNSTTATFQRNNKKKLRFPTSFWDPALPNDST